MMGVWQKFVLFLFYAQLLNGVLGAHVWFDVLAHWGELENDDALDETYKQLSIYLNLDTKRRDPMIRTICNGMRDVTEKVKRTLDIWKEFPALKQNTDILSPYKGAYYSVPKFQFKTTIPAIDFVKDAPDPYNADHFFEVQFSAPLILLAVDRCDDDNNCKMDKPLEQVFEAIRVLKGILNHKNNLVNIRSKVNKLKATYLSGKAIKASVDAAILFAYLEEMAPRFRDHVAHVKKMIQEADAKKAAETMGEDVNPGVTLLSKLIEILEQTPFVTGEWTDITYIKHVGDKIYIMMIREDVIHNYDRLLKKDELQEAFLPPKYEESEIIDWHRLMIMKSDGSLDDATYDEVFERLVRDSIAEFEGNQCRVLSGLYGVEGMQYTNRVFGIQSQLADECFLGLWNELESIDMEISQMNPQMDHTKVKARWDNVLSIAKWFENRQEHRKILQEIENFLTIVDIELKIWHDFGHVSQIPERFENLKIIPLEDWVATIQNTVEFMPEGFKALMANLAVPMKIWFEITSIDDEIMPENVDEAKRRHDVLVEGLALNLVQGDLNQRLNARLNTLGEKIRVADERIKQIKHQNEYGGEFRDDFKVDFNDDFGGGFSGGFSGAFSGAFSDSFGGRLY